MLKGSEIEWTTQTRLSLTGSHDSSISIRSLTPQTIEISGNPAKWLQGHNLFGSNDLRLLMWVFFNRLIEFYDIGLNPTIQDLERIKKKVVIRFQGWTLTKHGFEKSY